VIRADKVKFVADLNEQFAKSPHAVLATFRGLKVNQVNELRAKVGEAGGRYRVIKNRLAKRAAEGTGFAGLTEHLSGPCAIAMHESDPVALAKALSEFVKDNPQVELIAGLIDSEQVLDAAGVKQLSSLPALPELQAQLLALIQTPATTLVRLIQTPATQLGRVLDARREALEGGS
jgi:large subunit ribosomal protein L10